MQQARYMRIVALALFRSGASLPLAYPGALRFQQIKKLQSVHNENELADETQTPSDRARR
jgi:hypothetical protein